jgi:hypothetical protein
MLSYYFCSCLSDVAHFKSAVAAKAVCQLNSACKIASHTIYLDEQSCSTEYPNPFNERQYFDFMRYDSRLWQALGSVFSVVDSAAGRRFIYKLACLYHTYLK